MQIFSCFICVCVESIKIDKWIKPLFLCNWIIVPTMRGEYRGGGAVQWICFHGTPEVDANRRLESRSRIQVVFTQCSKRPERKERKTNKQNWQLRPPFKSCDRSIELSRRRGEWRKKEQPDKRESRHNPQPIDWTLDCLDEETERKLSQLISNGCLPHPHSLPSKSHICKMILSISIE